MDIIRHFPKEPTGNLSPYIEKEPVPSPFKKSPPVSESISQIDDEVENELAPCLDT
jgi:hypothetical protein